MLGDIGLELVKELHASQEYLPRFNVEKVSLVLEEMKTIFHDNQRDFLSEDLSDSVIADTGFRYMADERNLRCLLAYIHNRLHRIRQIRWKNGGTIPSSVQDNMSNNELNWASSYGEILASYMEKLEKGKGLNLMQYMTPPKSVYVEVRCLKDFGKFQLENGDVTMLKKNLIYFLPLSQCELLIHQGILGHNTRGVIKY